MHASRLLRAGGLLAHTTSTLPGVAAHPASIEGIHRLQRFKHRQGPFLLLAASPKAAMRWVRYFSPILRRCIKTSWPGNTTLIFAGRPGLPKACYRRGCLAVRVDADVSCRYLAANCGGLLVSSSLNRRGKSIQQPSCRLRWRWQRHLAASLHAGACANQPSSLLVIKAGRIRHLR